jgi:UDP-N-acetylenolpyruvoylglucosamine reductase
MVATEAPQGFSKPMEELAGALRSELSPATVLRAHEPLSKKTTLRVGGAADWYSEPASEADLAALLRFCAAQRLPWFVLGRGSNILVRDAGVRGVVICLVHGPFGQIEVQGQRLVCGAGVKLKRLAAEAKRNELAGLEFLEGIPGSVGGALRMNAGAMGVSTFDRIVSVRCMDALGAVSERSARGLPVEYRSCGFFKDHIALSAVFEGQPGSREEIEKRMNEFSRKRWASQPAAPSAGCMFKNPPALPAGRLIDELGLKGTRVGGASVSQEHGNFIVNDGTATARDVLELVEKIRARARAARAIELETEVEIIGE